LSSASASAVLDDVDIRSELERRPYRSPDYEVEHHAVLRLTAAARNPRDILQELVTVAVDLCDVDAAAVGLLDGESFQWEAVAGAFRATRGGPIRRGRVPFGMCIDHNCTLLVDGADPALPDPLDEPRCAEAMALPFRVAGKPMGTLWLASHRVDRRFDREDERLMRALSGLASTIWQLWRTAESLRESRRRKDEFIATLAHELRGPFEAIQSAESVLRDRSAGVEVTQVLDVIKRQGSHVARLVDDLLDVARVGAGKVVLNRRVVDLRTIIVDTVQAARLHLARTRHDLKLYLGEDPILLEADPVRLAQIVSNLVDNARKYTPADGTISVELRRSKDEVVFEVRDTGVGIPAESVNSIFEPFTQLPFAQPGGGPPGLGLGLPLVRCYAELHGGHVSVTSAGAGRGSCFTIRLPARRASGRLDSNWMLQTAS